MQRFLRLRLVLAVALSTILSCLGRIALCAGSLDPIDLRCEYLVNPLGIDVVIPRLSWILGSDSRARKQTYYQILISRIQKVLEQNQGNLWDTGKVQ